MILCLDVGNSQIFAGIFSSDKLLLRLRMNSQHNYTSDQYGIMLRSILKENDIDCYQIREIAMCSVVPQIDYSLRSACRKYFRIDPFILQDGIKKDLKIKYRNPLEIGADRIANAIAAIRLFPNKSIIIIDFGTATTLCAISKNREYLGGIILAGMRLSMNALQDNTTKLSSVEITRPKSIVGRSTCESIQSGLYYGQLSTLQGLINRIHNEAFPDEKQLIIIGTGGFAGLFEFEHLFTTLIPDLVLHGLRIALYENVK